MIFVTMELKIDSLPSPTLSHQINCRDARLVENKLQAWRIVCTLNYITYVINEVIKLCNDSLND